MGLRKTFTCDRCREEVAVVQPLDCALCNGLGIQHVCSECANMHELVLEQEKMYKYYKGEM